MSHNHEPEKAARNHKPAIIAIIVARLVALENEQYRLREHVEFLESLKEEEEPHTLSSGD